MAKNAHLIPLPKNMSEEENMNKLTISVPCRILPNVSNSVSKEDLDTVTHETTGKLRFYVEGGGGVVFDKGVF